MDTGLLPPLRTPPPAAGVLWLPGALERAVCMLETSCRLRVKLHVLCSVCPKSQFARTPGWNDRGLGQRGGGPVLERVPWMEFSGGNLRTHVAEKPGSMVELVTFSLL